MVYPFMEKAHESILHHKKDLHVDLGKMTGFHDRFQKGTHTKYAYTCSLSDHMTP